MAPHDPNTNDPGESGERPRITPSSSVNVISPVIAKEQVLTSVYRGASSGLVRRSTGTSPKVEASLAHI